ALGYAGFKVRLGLNDVRLGIAAVRARLEEGTLRVLAGRCPNLLREAALYRYSKEPAARKSEVPCDGSDHAMDALRYLIVRLDAHRVPRRRRLPRAPPTAEGQAAPRAAAGAPAAPPQPAPVPPPLGPGMPTEPAVPQPPAREIPFRDPKNKWLRYDNEALW